MILKYLDRNYSTRKVHGFRDLLYYKFYHKSLSQNQQLGVYTEIDMICLNQNILT